MDANFKQKSKIKYQVPFMGYSEFHAQFINLYVSWSFSPESFVMFQATA